MKSISIIFVLAVFFSPSALAQTCEVDIKFLEAMRVFQIESATHVGRIKTADADSENFKNAIVQLMLDYLDAFDELIAAKKSRCPAYR